MIGTIEVRLRILGARSLKEKRKVLKSIKDRFSRMNISIAEVDDHDKWQAATLGLAMVSNDTTYITSLSDRIIQFLMEQDEIEIIRSNREILHV
ncbi:MAG: DUF503 domain-containing protein [Desulfomonilia bacterium]